MKIKISYEDKSFYHNCYRYEMDWNSHYIMTFCESGDLCGLFRDFRCFEVVSTPSFDEVSEASELMESMDKKTNKFKVYEELVKEFYEKSPEERKEFIDKELGELDV